MSRPRDLDELPLAMSVTEVASALNVSPRLIYDVIDRGQLPAVRIGARMAIRVTKPALLEYLGMSNGTGAIPKPTEPHNKEMDHDGESGG